jgi:hypothetical protein
VVGRVELDAGGHPARARADGGEAGADGLGERAGRTAVQRPVHLPVAVYRHPGGHPSRRGFEVLDAMPVVQLTARPAEFPAQPLQFVKASGHVAPPLTVGSALVRGTPGVSAVRPGAPDGTGPAPRTGCRHAGVLAAEIIMKLRYTQVNSRVFFGSPSRNVLQR